MNYVIAVIVTAVSLAAITVIILGLCAASRPRWHQCPNCGDWFNEIGDHALVPPDGGPFGPDCLCEKCAAKRNVLEAWAIERAAKK